MVTRADGFGNTDTFDLWIEVRFFSGASCSTWTLSVEWRNC